MWIAAWLLGLVGAVVLAGLLLPRRVTVARSAVIATGRDTLFPLLASFRRGWLCWSPWGPRVDPDVEVMYSGAEAGVGASMRWRSASLGNGEVRLVAADPERGVAYELLPLTGRYVSTGRLDFADDPGGLMVTWSTIIDLGPNPLMHYLGPLVRAGLTRAFGEGLSALKREAERPRGHA